MNFRNFFLINLVLICLFALKFGYANQPETNKLLNNWLIDNKSSERFTIDGNRLVFSKRFDAFNVQNYFAINLGLSASQKNKRYYWEFICTGYCTSVGIAKKDAISKEEIKAAFFDGNLRDGRNVLVKDFGDQIRHGNRVGFILDLSDTDLKIYIVQKDRPLGLAFVQSAPYAEELYPIFSFAGSGSADVKEKEISNLDDYLKRTDYSKITLIGKYKLIKAIENGQEKILPNYVLSLRNFIDEIHLQSELGESYFTASLIEKGKDKDGMLYNIDENPWRSIKGIQGKEMDDLKYYFDTLRNVKRVQFPEDFSEVKLITSNATLTFKRFVAEKEPVKTSTLLS